MKKWLLHEQMLQNPPTDLMRDVHLLQPTQTVPLLDANSALRGNMPRQMGRAWTTDGCNAPRTTESITEKDYVAFFHQFFGFTNNSASGSFKESKVHPGAATKERNKRGTRPDRPKRNLSTGSDPCQRR